MSNIFPRARLLLVGFLASLLCGCWGMPGLIWEEAIINGKPSPGALNVGNVRPTMWMKCGTAEFMANGPICSWAFIDSNARRVSLDDIRDELDLFLEGLPQFREWINKRPNYKSERERQFPYNLYLLTISPSVVMVVPVDKNKGRLYCSGRAPTGCIYSKSFDGRLYFFRDNPPIVPGSFLLSPSMPNSTVSIDSSSTTVQTQIGNAEINLVADNGIWAVSRDK